MILAIDTATRWTGLALHDGTSIIAEMGWQAINTQTIELSPAIAEMWRRTNTTATQLKGIAVAIGPGSYTGLRVGVAVAKGLALANGTPLVAVSTLDILASSMGRLTGQLCVVAEAGRSRVCTAVYRWRDKKGWQLKGEPDIDRWSDLLARLTEPTVFLGEVTAEAAALIRAEEKPFHLLPASHSVRRAGYLAELGRQRLRRGQSDDPSALTPVYLRQPDGSKT